jgi:hypothetical protein
MKLVKGRPRNLPVGFLIEVAQSYAVCQQLIQLLCHFEPHGLFQFQMKSMGDGTVALNLGAMLVYPRLSAEVIVISRAAPLCHRDYLLKLIPVG